MKTSLNSFPSRISYMIINTLWYLSSLLFTLALAGLIVAPILDFEIPDSFAVSSSIHLEEIVISNTEIPHYISFKETKGSISANHILEKDFKNYLGIIFSTVLLGSIFLFGLYQLKMLLRSVLNSEIFSAGNIKKMRLIGLMFLVFDPIEHLIYMIFVNPLFGEFKIDWFEFSFQIPFESNFVTGLLILVLAEVFAKGYQLHEEQKLTV